MRQVLIRIPLDSPWFFGIPGFGFGIVLLAWVAFGGYWLYRNRRLLKESPAQLAVPAVVWGVLATGVVLLPGLVHRSTDRELAAAQAALSDADFGSAAYREIHTQRDRAWRRRQLFDDAIREYESEIAAHPRFAPAYYRLAWILATAPDDAVRDGERAVKLAKRAVELSHKDRPIVLDTLGAAHAEAGEFQEAVQAVTRALQKATSSQDARKE